MVEPQCHCGWLRCPEYCDFFDELPNDVRAGPCVTLSFDKKASSQEATLRKGIVQYTEVTLASAKNKTLNIARHHYDPRTLQHFDERAVNNTRGLTLTRHQQYSDVQDSAYTYIENGSRKYFLLPCISEQVIADYVVERSEGLTPANTIIIDENEHKRSSQIFRRMSERRCIVEIDVEDLMDLEESADFEEEAQEALSQLQKTYGTAELNKSATVQKAGHKNGAQVAEKGTVCLFPPARRALVVGVAIAALLITLLAILGATGHFQQSSSPAAPSAQAGGEYSGTTGNDHDTEKPDTGATVKPVPADPAQLSPLRHPTYRPGLLTVEENGLLLSQGLTSRLIAQRRRQVVFANGELSEEPFHRRPDYGATFPVPPDATENKGGYVYVSNSELGGPPSGLSGVGALYFDKDGSIVDYKMLLTNTTTNCAGGRTPWGTFISCEEVRDVGQVWQVDPFDRRPPERTTMGKLGGRYEAFAYDDRDNSTPRFFVTEDMSNGPTLRWTPEPNSIDWEKPWDILTGSGTLDYLLLKPVIPEADNYSDGSSGTFEWTSNLTLARENADRYARGTEGIDRKDKFLYFVCKTNQLFYILDLDEQTFVMYPTSVGLFDGEPDQVQRMVNDTQDILYFSEESTSSGIHGRNSKGQFFTILEGVGWPDSSVTGLAFSPNGLHMYICYQDDGVVFDITREDGHPFHGVSLEVHYHNPPLDHYIPSEDM